MKLRCYFLLTLFLTGLASGAITRTYRLDNGLQLIVRVDKRAPLAVSEVWYKVGASYEHNGLTGISHVLEHMMFRGTQDIGPGQFAQRVTINGGQFNAFTSNDYTAYYEEVTADKLPLMFKLEADRMRNLNLTNNAFSKEVQVVMEERRLRTDDNPQALTAERFNAAAYIASPYHHPVIGWMKDLKGLTGDKIRQWYKTWYAPNNAIVVVVGDVKPEQVLKWVKKYFGPLKPETIPKAVTDGSIKPLGKRTVDVNAAAKLPWSMMGYNVPVLNSVQQAWQPYALAVLDGILDGGESARLPRRLVRQQQLAASVNVSYDPFARLNTLFTITATPAQGHSVQQVQQAIAQQIKNLKTKPVSTAELKRVKAQVIADRVFSKDSMIGQANEIGALEAVGLSWKVGENFADKINQITIKQVEQVARKFLTQNRLTVAVLTPKQTS